MTCALSLCNPQIDSACARLLSSYPMCPAFSYVSVLPSIQPVSAYVLIEVDLISPTHVLLALSRLALMYNFCKDSIFTALRAPPCCTQSLLRMTLTAPANPANPPPTRLHATGYWRPVGITLKVTLGLLPQVQGAKETKTRPLWANKLLLYTDILKRSLSWRCD